MGFCHISHFLKWLGKVVAWFLLSTHFFRLRNCDFKNILNFDLSNLLLIFLPIFNQIGSKMAIFSIVYSLKNNARKRGSEKEPSKNIISTQISCGIQFLWANRFLHLSFSNQYVAHCLFIPATNSETTSPELFSRILFFFKKLFLKKVAYWLLC